MRHIFILFLAFFVFSTCSESQYKLSRRQERLSVYIKKFQDDIVNAPDSASKMNVLIEMWRKHIVFIQDTLGFTYYPVHTLDTFYFERAIVNRTTQNKKKYLDVLLENKNYLATVSYDVTSNSNLQEIPIYRILTNLKENVPVLAVLNLQDFSLSDRDIDKGSKKLILKIELNSIYNIK